MIPLNSFKHLDFALREISSEPTNLVKWFPQQMLSCLAVDSSVYATNLKKFHLTVFYPNVSTSCCSLLWEVARAGRTRSKLRRGQSEEKGGQVKVSIMAMPSGLNIFLLLMAFLASVFPRRLMDLVGQSCVERGQSTGKSAGGGGVAASTICEAV